MGARVSVTVGRQVLAQRALGGCVFKTPHLLTFLSSQELKFTFQIWETTSFLACIEGNLSPRKGSKL